MQRKQPAIKPITLGVMESIYVTSNGRLPSRRRGRLAWMLVDCVAIGAFVGLVAMIVSQVAK